MSSIEITTEGDLYNLSLALEPRENGGFIPPPFLPQPSSVLMSAASQSSLIESKVSSDDSEIKK